MNICIAILLFLTIAINSTKSTSFTYPQLPTVSTNNFNNLIINCKVHVLNICDRHCNVCETVNLNVTSPDVVVKEVTGFSIRNFVFVQNVLRLSINNQVCHFIPQKSDEFFPNLETLRIWSSGLKKLEQKDIKGFPNLKELILPLNDIESLDSNLFEFNKKLSKFDINRNKLKNVGLALFSSSKLLLNINFNHNECINDNFKNRRKNFVEIVRKFCPPTLDMLKNDVVFLIEQNEKIKLTIEVKDKLIKGNCDCRKFEDVENHFGEEKGTRYEEFQI